MRNLQSIRLDGFWLVMFAASVWGTVGVATQAIYNVDSTTPMFINLVRIGLAAPILMAIGWRRLGPGMFRVNMRDLLLMMATGTCLVLSYVAYFAAIGHIGVTIGTLLTLCIAPLSVALVSAVLGFEKITQQVLIAMAFALTGIVLLVGVNPAPNPEYNIVAGVGFCALAAAWYTGTLIIGRFLAVSYPPVQVMAFGLTAGTLVLLVLNLGTGMAVLQTTQGWLLAVYMGLVPTAFAYTLFQLGLRTVTATTASILVLMEPLVASVLAWLLFDERLTLAGLVGVALMVASLVMLARRRSEA